MRKVLLAVVFVVTFPSLSAAAACIPDSLSGYVLLGATGCEIGGATFSDFISAPSFFLGGDEISAAVIQVVPRSLASGPGLDFLLTGSAGPGDLLGVAIGYTVAGSSFSGADLEMLGSAAGPDDGVVTVVEDICLGDLFVTDPSFCGSFDSRSLIVAHDPIGPIGPDSTGFVASFFDIFVDITIDGGPGPTGFAALGDTSGPGIVSTRFRAAAVPEPAVISLFGSGLLGIWALSRRRF